MPSLSNRQGPAMWLPRVPRFAFDEPPNLKPIRYLLTGVTKDSSGVALGGCTIEVFENIPGAVDSEPKGRLVNMATSDASGNYSVEVHAGKGVTFQCDAYKAGAPDVSGTTVNTFVPTAT